MMNAIARIVRTDRAGARTIRRTGVCTLTLPGSRRRRRTRVSRWPAAAEVRREQRIDGAHAYGTPHGERARDERDEQPEQRSAGEEPELERRLPDRQAARCSRMTESTQFAIAQPNEHAERDTDDRDLGREQHRADRDLARREAERHRDADVAPLGLDDALGEIERREAGAREDHEREDVEEMPLAAHLVVERAHRRLVASAR